MRIVVEFLFPLHFRFLALLAAPISVPIYYNFGIIPAVLLIVFSTALLTGLSEVEINMERRKYRQFISFLWIFKFGKSNTYKEISEVYMTKSGYRQTMHLGPASNTTHGVIYEGYLLMDGGERTFIGRRKSKQKMVRKLENLATQLQVEFVDYTI